MIHRTDNTTTTTSRPVRWGWDISMQYYYIDPGRRGHNQSRAPDPYFRRDGTLRHPAPPPPEGGGGLRGAGGGSRQRRARGGPAHYLARGERPPSRGAGRGGGCRGSCNNNMPGRGGGHSAVPPTTLHHSMHRPNRQDDPQKINISRYYGRRS